MARQKKKPVNTSKIAVIVIIAALVIGSLGFMIGANQTQQKQPDQSSTAASAPAIDGIRCESMEGSVQHIHSHLTIVNNGKTVVVPEGIGIHQENQCLYWLHTHDETGEIHVESPETRTFTLGNFFDVWGQALTKSQVGTLTENKEIRAFVDGKPFTGDPRSIKLGSHTSIVLEVGPTFIDPPANFTFPAGD